MNTPNGISVYDDEFTWSQRNLMLEFIQKSKYIISAPDIGALNESLTPNLPFLISEWGLEDLNRFGILTAIQNKELLEKMEGKTIKRCFTNLDAQKEIHHVHNHPGQEVLLYQANLEWRSEWYGETFFYDDNKEEVIYVNQYTPGRLIFFDGNIPHAFRPPSRIAPHFRFTLSIFIENKKKES